MYGLAMDVSNNNPVTEAVVKASKARLLICKGTEGSNFVDKTISHHRAIAKALNIPFGLYLFLHSNSKGDEAEYFLKHALPHKDDIVIIDSEPGGQDGKSIAQMALRTHSCALELEKNGFNPLLYASSSYWTQMYYAFPVLKRLKVWEAQYPGRFTRWSPRLAKLRAKIGHGATVVMWQWTDVFAGKYDMSVMFTSPEKMR